MESTFFQLYADYELMEGKSSIFFRNFHSSWFPDDNLSWDFLRYPEIKQPGKVRNFTPSCELELNAILASF